MSQTASSIARRLVLGLALGSGSAVLSGCMTAALLSSVPERIHTLAKPEHVWVERRLELGPGAVARHLTECKNDTTWDAGQGTKTTSKPVSTDGRAQYEVYSVGQTNLVTLHMPACLWEGAPTAPVLVSVGILEKTASGWTITEAVNQTPGLSASSLFYRWQSRVGYKEQPPLRGDEIAPNAELTAMLTNAMSSGALIAPPTAVLAGLAPAVAGPPKLEFAESLLKLLEADCKGNVDCSYLRALTRTAGFPAPRFPATLREGRWHIDLDVPPNVRLAYLQDSRPLSRLPLELNGREVNSTALFASNSGRSRDYVYGWDSSRGYYFQLRQSRASGPFAY